MANLLNRRSQCLLDRPSAKVESLANSRRIDSGSFRPFDYGHGFVAEGQVSVMPSIPALLLWSSPLAVVWFVIPVVVLAVKLESWLRNFPHISQEVFKTVSPAVADLDTTTSPILELLSSWIVASLFHSKPAAIFRRTGQTMRDLSASLRRTATMFYLAIHKINGTYKEFVSAIASAFPKDGFILPKLTAFPFVKNCQLPKVMPASIDKVCHFNVLSLGWFTALIIPQEANYR